MNTAAVPTAQAGRGMTARAAPPRRGRTARRRALSRGGAAVLALSVLLIVSFLLRIWGIEQGLPYSYNSDEATHFVPRAIAFFSGDFNPRYFLNPPAFSYLVHFVLELWFGSPDAASRAYAQDPTSVFVLARVVVAVLGTVSVWLTYLAGSRLFGRAVGLLAAAIFGLSFLPIFYSHLALNDVPALAPVALSLYGIAGVVRRGRVRDYALAGAGVGLAAATKYTAGITLVCLLGAFACDVAVGSFRPAARRLAVGLLAALAAFLIANPYAVLDPNGFFNGISQQASQAGGSDPFKLGTTSGGGIAYYLWTFTWGMGWGPALAALAGAGLLLARRRVAMALVLLPAPAAFIVYMGVQQRYFGRWLMPLFPIAALLGAYAAVELVRWLHRRRLVPAAVAGAAVTVLLLAQSVAAVLHDDAVLSRPDTRNMVRAWMVDHIPAGAKVVIEPVVPNSWVTDVGHPLRWTQTGGRWYQFATWLTDVDQSGRLLPKGQRRYVLIDQYERTLRPELLDEYRHSGYCWIVTGSLQEGRAFAQPRAVPEAIAYYRALDRQAVRLYHQSPFGAGTKPVAFNFDFSIDYYPRAYRLPGPEMSVYRLDNCR